MYAILIIIVILILAAVLYMSGAFGGGGEDATDINADVNIENPVGDGGEQPRNGRSGAARDDVDGVVHGSTSSMQVGHHGTIARKLSGRPKCGFRSRLRSLVVP